MLTLGITLGTFDIFQSGFTDFSQFASLYCYKVTQ